MRVEHRETAVGRDGERKNVLLISEHSNDCADARQKKKHEKRLLKRTVRDDCGRAGARVGVVVPPYENQ